MKLLVPLDGSPRAERALPVAASIARGAKGTLDAIMVHEPVPFAGFGSVPRDIKHATDEERYLARTASDVQRRLAVPVTHVILHGNAAEAICARARDTGADLIVMTSHGRTGFSRALLGSVADDVLRRSNIPVLMLRPNDADASRRVSEEPYQRILVPLDGSPVALDILPAAAALAQSSGAMLDLLHVVPRVPAASAGGDHSLPHATFDEDVQATKRLAVEARQALADAVRTLVRLGSPHVETHVIVSDDAVREILEATRAHQSSAIAMSTQGRGASRLLVGSVADRVIRGTELPILLRRPVDVSAGAHFVTTGNLEEQLPALVKRNGQG